MRVHRINYSQNPRPLPPGTTAALFGRERQTIRAGDGTVRLELDLAVALERGELVIVMPDTAALAEIGLVPLGVAAFDSTDGVVVLGLTVVAPERDVAVPIDRPLARLVAIETPAVSFYEDATLSDALSGDELALEDAIRVEEHVEGELELELEPER